jgi:hypothetical protein
MDTSFDPHRHAVTVSDAEKLGKLLAAGADPAIAIFASIIGDKAEQVLCASIGGGGSCTGVCVWGCTCADTRVTQHGQCQHADDTTREYRLCQQTGKPVGVPKGSTGRWTPCTTGGLRRLSSFLPPSHVLLPVCLLLCDALCVQYRSTVGSVRCLALSRCKVRA